MYFVFSIWAGTQWYCSIALLLSNAFWKPNLCLVYVGQYVVLQMFFLLFLCIVIRCDISVSIFCSTKTASSFYLSFAWYPAVPTVPYCHSMKIWKSLQLYLFSFLQYKIWNTLFCAQNNCLNITTLLLCFSYCIILLNQAACLYACVCVCIRGY